MRPLILIILVVGVLQAAIGLGIFYLLSSWTEKVSFGSVFGGVSAVFSGLAFAAVFYTLQYALRRELASYLRIDLSVRSLDSQTAFAKVCIENQSDQPKALENAILFITPEAEALGDSWEALQQAYPEVPDIIVTNDIAAFKAMMPLYAAGGRALVPLPFFYEENVRISDESISYTALIDTTGMTPGVVYSARLFVSGENRLHRTTHDAFKVSQP